MAKVKAITLSTDQLNDTSSISPLGKLILTHREEIIHQWALKAREQLIEAKNLQDPILVNTLPTFLDNLAEAVSPGHPRLLSTTSNTAAEEHGGERARLTNYTHTTLIKEYQILRQVILSKLQTLGAQITDEEASIIHSSLDDAIHKAATAFCLIQAEFREQIVATLGHDMRSPLATASLAADMILLKSNDPEIRKLAEKIKSNQKRIDGMLQDLLNTTLLKSGSKIQPKISKCEIKALIQEILDELPEIQAKRFTILGGKVEGFWDPELLKRSIENLFSNALKYGFSGHGITVQLTFLHERLTLSVHNEGPAIDVSEQEAIFQIFRRANSIKGKQPGWGLGLPLVRAVAEAHGGSITVDSSQESGTTFLIDIPVDARPFN